MIDEKINVQHVKDNNKVENNSTKQKIIFNYNEYRCRRRRSDIYDSENNNNNNNNQNPQDGKNNINVTREINLQDVPSAHHDSWSGSGSNCVSVVASSAFIDEITSSRMHDSSTLPCSFSSHSFQHSTSSFEEVEAPVSPSAYRSYINDITSENLLTIAPSPPLEQDDYSGNNKVNILQSAAVKSFKRQISSLKKQIKEYEIDFQSKHGYPPSMEQKMNSTLARPVLLELNNLNKLLKDLKEAKMKKDEEYANSKNYFEITDSSNFVPSFSLFEYEEHLNNSVVEAENSLTSKGKHFNLSCNCNSSSSSSNSESESLCKFEQILHKIEDSMTSKRISCNRPKEITLMTAGQIIDEKSDLQHLLLHFESTYGRPDCEKHRQIMKSIYDRYRSVKRLVEGMPTVSTVTVPVEKSVTNVQTILAQTQAHFGESMNSTKVYSSVTSSSNETRTSKNSLEQTSNITNTAATGKSKIFDQNSKNVTVEFKRLTCNSSSSSDETKFPSKSSSKPSANEVATTTTSAPTTTNATIIAISPNDLARIKKQQGVAICLAHVTNSKKKSSSNFDLKNESDNEIMQFHQMEHFQLKEHLNRLENEKKQLQKVICTLEDDMSKKLGRKIEREDRIHPVYTSYKVNNLLIFFLMTFLYSY